MNDGRSESGGWKTDAAIKASKHEARLWSLERRRRLNSTLTHLLNLILLSHHQPTAITTTPAKMAAASTSTLLAQQDQDHLRDYTIRLTGAPTPPHPEDGISRPPSPSPTLESPSAAQQQNPPGWESSYRQVPPHRPINRTLDAESRPWGAHGGQSPVIFAMMHGVWLKAVGLFSDCSFSQHGWLADVDESRWRGSGERREGG